MSSLAIRLDPSAEDVEVTDRALRMRLSHGRELSAPLEWFPRVRGATEAQRANRVLISKGSGIHWVDVDDDVSVAGLLRIA